jgi:hypothetical protein
MRAPAPAGGPHSFARGGNTMNSRVILSLSVTMVSGLFWRLFLCAALDLGLSELSDSSILVFVNMVITIVFAFGFHFIA